MVNRRSFIKVGLFSFIIPSFSLAKVTNKDYSIKKPPGLYFEVGHIKPYFEYNKLPPPNAT